MKKIVFFHRNKKAGFSINKVTQTIVSCLENKEEYYVPYSGASAGSLIRNILFVFRRRNKKYINHITGDVHYCLLGLVGCTSVLTIHDTVGVDFCKLSFIKRKILEWFWYRIPLKIASSVVCISEATKKSVLRYTKRKDIVVIHDALSPKIEFSPKLLNLKKPRILIIGTNVNKNLVRTFEALAGLSCFVVVVGKLSDEQIKCLKSYNIEFENMWDLSDEDIIKEYKECDIVSFVSLFEGFGMPIIEANAVGRPVVCSNIPVLREVAGDAAEFTNPYDVAEIRKAFARLMEDESVSMSLIEKGRMNIQRFKQDNILGLWRNFYLSL